MAFHPEILTHTQKRVLKLLGPFTDPHDFYLAGGTALAIHLTLISKDKDLTSSPELFPL
jgi:hypothetical protein